MKLFLFVLIVAAVHAQEDLLPTVDDLLVPQYVGRWFQTYASPLVLGTFERDGFCVTATYGVFNETVLTVYNHMLIASPTGNVSDINGFAFTTEDPGKLIVNLIGGSGDGNYWVMKLGPVSNYNGVEQYAYSLVSEPNRLSLFVLVRDVEEFEALYEEEVLEWLFDNGFDSEINNPLPVYHGDNCLYPEEDEEDEVPTVGELAVPLYTGLWYQPYASPLVTGTFERDGYCVTATYDVYNASTLTVYNHMLIGAPDGNVADIDGYAYTTDEAGKLLVSLDGGTGAGNYWVMKLGPVTNYNGVEQYAYSLVSEPNALGMYVLVRNMEEFIELYEDEVLTWLSQNGFDKPTNNPVAVYQGDDCLYPEPEDLITTVDELEIPLYLGRWYQTFGSPFVLATEIRNGTCVSADYGLYNESTITVYNHQRKYTPDGEVADITGYAYATEDPGKLLVDFGFDRYGDYWVMKLGPVNNYDGEDLYAYSLVSEPRARNLYVLCRDTEEFNSLYEESVLTWLYENGFDSPTNNPLPIYHGSDCLYPPM